MTLPAQTTTRHTTPAQTTTAQTTTAHPTTAHSTAAHTTTAQTTTWPDPSDQPGAGPHRSPATASLGDAAARLLSGPRTREDLNGHLARLGPLPSWEDGVEALLQTVERAGLTGRGGGHFPLASKIAAASRAAHRDGAVPVVVVNATESEPASGKDRHLLEYRPHLVIDGAVTVAAACGADRVVVAGHVGSPALASLEEALGEHRDQASYPRLATRVEVATVPNRYIAGESSSLVSYLGGGPALPTSRTRPTAESGLGGRPTVVSNAETLAHLALVVRHGAPWFRQAGSSSSPGSLLVTLGGDVASPGEVVEILRPVSLAEVVERHGRCRRWQAVLLGGYGGVWVRRDHADDTLLVGGRSGQGGPSIGCGLIAVIGERRCGLAESARVLSWLSGQRAGQCGACSLGLPLISDEMTALAEGRSRPRRTQRRVASLAHSVAGRGRCHLPEGAIAMAESALEVFADEATLHRRGRCRSDSPPGAFPLPFTEGMIQ